MLNRICTCVCGAMPFMIFCILSLGTAMPVLADDRSEAMLNKYLQAVGGRDLWAEGRGEYVLAKIKDPRFPLPGTFEICLSWERPLSADRLRIQDSTRYRVYTGTDGWSVVKSSGAAMAQITDWDENRKARGYSEWSENFEVITHRLAKRDPEVGTRMGTGPWKGWLEISVRERIAAYLLLNEEGAPRKFYRVFDDTAVVFGPLVERGALKFPAWGSFEGGEPFDLIAFEILAVAPTEPFRRPDATSPGYLHCQ